MDGTIIGSGEFTQSNPAVAQLIQIPSGVDGLRVYNWTQIAAGGNISYFDWKWNLTQQAVIDPTRAMTIAINGAMALSAPGSFVLYNPNFQNFESVTNPVAITNITNAGVVSTANTAGLSIGSVVRLSNLGAVGAQNLGGIDFVVTAVVNNVSFTIIPVNPMGINGATTGFYRIVGGPLFIPQIRTIANIVVATGVVTTTTNHGFQIGQEVRFSVPTISATQYGTTQLDGIAAIVETVPSLTTFTTNINMAAFGAFSFPTGAQQPFTPAIVVPFGDDTATALAQVPPLSSLEDRVFNTGTMGMILSSGMNNPAGVAADFISWEAYKGTFGGQ